VSDELHAPAALPPGKELRYPFHRGLGGPQRRSRRGGGERKKSLPYPCRESNPSLRARSLVSDLVNDVMYIFISEETNHCSSSTNNMFVDCT
jgi:hypothetical protein